MLGKMMSRNILIEGTMMSRGKQAGSRFVDEPQIKSASSQREQLILQYRIYRAPL